MGDDRAIVYVEGDWVIYRASSIGKPVRCLAAAREGAEALPAPEYLIRAAEAGNRYEGVVKDRLRAEGWIVPEEGEQEFVEVVVREPEVGKLGIKVRGHLDAWSVSKNRGDDRMLEVKSMSGRVFDEWVAHEFARFPEYAAQLTCYMKATNKPALYAVVCRDDEDGEERLLLKEVDEPPMDFATLAQKTLIVEAFFDQGRLPTCDGTSKYQCPYSYLCDAQDVRFSELESGDDETMRRLLEEYAAQGRLIEELKSNQAVVKADLEKAMGKRKSVKIDGWVVSRVAEGERKGLDAAALRGVLGNRLDEFYKTSKVAAHTKVTPPTKGK